MSEVGIPELVVNKVGELTLRLLYAEEQIRVLTAQVEALTPGPEDG